MNLKTQRAAALPLLFATTAVCLASRYNAAQTLSDFSARLRNEVDLDALGRELVGVVGVTMEPAHATLWLRPSHEEQVWCLQAPSAPDGAHS